MPLSDIERIEAEYATPRIVTLHRALVRLRSTVSFMNTGAHPDDETSALLAALGYRDGLDISYTCANRGEGGQNDLGTEASDVLGTLRTAEMERAADALDLRLYWLSTAPTDTIFDFGFSKSGLETLQRWGHERTLERFITIVRRERPDILCPTFLDLPGQHGHHRAMTALAHEVMDRAADPTYITAGLAPWQPAKLYLPAWGGSGTAYDDEQPPPAATLTIDASGVDPITGWSWEHVGQQSRRWHRTQGMGRWIAAGAERNWPLHLARSSVEGPDIALTSGLPRDCSELAKQVDGARLRNTLSNVHNAIEEALAAYPDQPTILAAACHALYAVRSAREQCSAQHVDQLCHRLERKEAQLSTVIRMAAGVDAHGRLLTDRLRPGESTELNLELRTGELADAASVTLSTTDDWSLDSTALTLASVAPPCNTYPDHHFPDMPRPPALAITVTTNGIASTSHLPLEVEPTALPACSAGMEPAAVLLNTVGESRRFTIRLSAIQPPAAHSSLTLPEGWAATRTDVGFDVSAPDALLEGQFSLPLTLDGTPASTERVVSYPHISDRVHVTPAEARVLATNIALGNARIGYIGGGSDRVAYWLQAMGMDVTSFTDSDISDAGALLSALAGVDTLVVGLFAMRTRPALRTSIPVVHHWIQQGGHLLTLYHRPWDAWDALEVPPYRLEIGQPSLRWRVTDEAAHVTHLVADHPLLNTPNVIINADWADWHKERGLYFAKSWDSNYEALLAMTDPDEESHHGALLSARVGKGRHTHTSLVLHHQMEQLVPGAFRLMANLVNTGI